MTDKTVPLPPAGVSAARRLVDWSKRHPWRTTELAIGFLLLADLSFLPWGTLASYADKNPLTTAFQQDYLNQLSLKGRRATLDKRWVPLSAISENVIQAVIVAEDGSFWNHSGFDWYEFRESIIRNIREKRAARGASTITQQLVKNLFLSPSKNPIRKFHDWVLTWYAEHALSKRRILELYMNEIEWGPGIYGVEAASQSTYNISASTLTRDQSARLAAVIPNPRRYRPLGNSRIVERRTSIILSRMAARDRVRGRVEIPDAEDDDEAATPDTLNEQLEANE